MAFSEGGTPCTVRVDFYEDAVTFREKEGAVEEITSGDQIYQAYMDLVHARVPTNSAVLLIPLIPIHLSLVGRGTKMLDPLLDL